MLIFDFYNSIKWIWAQMRCYSVYDCQLFQEHSLLLFSINIRCQSLPFAVFPFYFLPYLSLFCIFKLFMMQNRTKSSSLEKESSNNQQPKKTKEKSAQKEGGRGGKKHIVALGVCAMKKKVQSKPMKEILRRLRCKEIQIIEMWEYLDLHWSEWPKVDALICFHSDGFPFLMAWKYVQKHKPFLINNLDKQQLLWDRTVVYDILKRIKVPVAKHYFIFRDHNYLDQIQKRGNGKVVEDPPHFESEKPSPLLSERGKVKQRISLNEPMSFSSFSGLTGIGGSAGKETTTENLIAQAYIIRQQMEQEVKSNLSEVGLRKAQLKEQLQSKSKMKSRYSNDPSNASDSPTKKSYPSCLRSYCENRHPDHYKYQVEQSEDTLLIKCGDQVHKLKKPFVEKPFDSQNHQICIYYPQSMGGGRKKLFRKVKDCSSNYQTNENSIRTQGNYIYEQFLPTNAFDIKVYTIGPYYMYAQARRSPTLDGVVQRNQDGKEIRFPVILSPDEKFICNRIVQQFQQEVCGFDLLRANGKSYVCDVNGWSFVKGNPKYWDDCATILTKKIFNHFFPDQIRDYPMFDQNSHKDFRLPMDNLKPKVEELRSIVSIFRHGDRSPKLKLKIKTSDPRFIEFFAGVTKDEIKFKDAKNLTKILQICNNIIAELQNADPLLKDYLQMKLVLQEGGHFEGFTRKLQLKVVERAQKTEQQAKGAIKKVMIVLKWGGQLSYFGYQDAIQLGKKMRIERYDDHDCLSLYSQYRHDLKTYSSDEGRCIKTAAAFLKGFLSIEGQLAPIISSMVKADPKAQRLLDCTSSQNHSLLADQLQVRLTEIMNRQEDLMKSYLQYRGEEIIPQSMRKVIETIGRPREMLKKLYDLIKELVFQIQRIYLENWEQDGLHQRISHHQQLDDQLKCEDIVLVSGRWSKIKKDFFNSESKQFNISKVPEIYDTIRHDFRKNGLIFNLVDQAIKDELFQTAESLAYFVVINEYGITDKERIKVAQDICLPLFEKILIDLMFWKAKNSEDSKYWHYKDEEEMSAQRAIRTRLYFTSASHIYSLINLLTLGNNRYLISRTPQKEARDALNVLYLGYLSHLQFRLYENLVMNHSDPHRFRLEISFSTEYKKTKKMKEFSLGGNGFNINEISQFIQSLLSERKVEVLSKEVLERNEKRKHSD